MSAVVATPLDYFCRVFAFVKMEIFCNVGRILAQLVWHAVEFRAWW